MTPVHEDTPSNNGGGILNILLILVTVLLVYKVINYIDKPLATEDFPTTIEEPAN